MPDIYAYTSDPEVTRYVFFDTHDSPEDTAAYIASFGRPNKTGWAMQHRDSGRVIGIVFLHSIDERVRAAEIAYSVSPDRWRQGYATEATSAVLDHCFANTSLETIEGACMIDHHASARVLEKAGLTFLGVREKSRSKNGVAHDLRHFAIDRQSWLSRTERTRRDR